MGLIAKPKPVIADEIKLDENLTESDVKRVNELFKTNREYLVGRKIMAKLKKNLPQLTLLTEDFTENDVFDRLELILVQLETQASGADNTFCQPICKIAPKAEHNQWLHY